MPQGGCKGPVSYTHLIILPRNVHRSVINALVLTGAIPVYVNPQMNDRLGICLLYTS